MKAPTNVNEAQRLTGRITALCRFKVLREAKNIESDTSCQQAFEELKKYLAELPPLVKPIERIPSTWVKAKMPLKQTLGKLNSSGRLVKLTVELTEYDILYLPHMTIKAQTLANFISEMAGIPLEEVFKVEKWLLHVDGSSTTQASCAGIVITLPYGEDLEFAVKFGFKPSINEIEYVALIIDMKMAHKARVRHPVAYSDSQLIVK
ncbi:UNVERIFIED_CONTAM: hypothetical protein Scaly_2916900 [Sesamum calycinum]|uniref:RNase H type-1 domain-containing protein n=1 Tax=Sesamum calycinum TaxID=2727403 RepID=A0AAW2L0F7_9LAMI